MVQIASDSSDVGRDGLQGLAVWRLWTGHNTRNISQERSRGWKLVLGRVNSYPMLWYVCKLSSAVLKRGCKVLHEFNTLFVSGWKRIISDVFKTLIKLVFIYNPLKSLKLHYKPWYHLVLHCRYLGKFLHVLLIYVYQNHVPCETGCCHIMNYVVLKKSKYLDISDPVKYPYFISGFLITVGL